MFGHQIHGFGYPDPHWHKIKCWMRIRIRIETNGDHNTVIWYNEDKKASIIITLFWEIIIASCFPLITDK